MKTYEQLLNNVIGQLKGIQKMIDQEKECFQVLTQLKAAKSALKSVTNKYLQENLVACLAKSDESQESICQKFVKELNS